MADNLPTPGSYKLLGGINQKASRYQMSTAQFLDLRNLDFDVPNSLQKRPGSTYTVDPDNAIDGPVSSLFEFVRLTGESYIIAGSDTSMYYLTGNSLTLLDSDWDSGQRADILTFIDKAWMANGQNFKWWDGTTMSPAGLPLSPPAINMIQLGYTMTYLFAGNMSNASPIAGSYFLVNGATMCIPHDLSGNSSLVRSVYMSYSYVRTDGYSGPVDFQTTARNLVLASPGNGVDFFSSYNTVGGFTVPDGYGISAIALWIAEDTIGPGATLTQQIPGIGARIIGSLGWRENHSNTQFNSITLRPNADLTKFFLYTLISPGSLFLTDDGFSATYWACTLSFGTSYAYWDNVAPLSQGWQGTPTDFFASYIPKYIEVNQNIMFLSGFSAKPSTVAFSEVGDPETYFPEDSFEVRTNDGDRIYGKKSFNNQLIICKEKSFHKLIGNNPNNFQLVEISNEFGCISENTMITKDQTIYWLDRKGILQYNGANFKIASDAVEGIFRRMNIEAAKDTAVGLHVLYRNQLWWGIPIDGSEQNNITIVYDYLIGAWTFFDGFNPSALAYIKGESPRPVAWRGDYGGLLHSFGESLFSDSDQGITCLAFTVFENANGENATTLWRRLFLDVAQTADPQEYICGNVFTNYDTETVQATFMVEQDKFQTRVEMGVQGKAIAAEFSHFSFSLPLLINGYAWANRPLRNV